MPATKVTLRKVSAEACIKLAWRTARDLGYHVADGSRPHSFVAQKGNLAATLMLGAISPYCKLIVAAEPYEDGTVDLIVERNSTWLLQGWAGARQVKSNAQTLVAETVVQIEKAGGEVIATKEI